VRDRDGVAAGIATALLAGSWTRSHLTRRVSAALGQARAPEWVSGLTVEVLAAYRDPPTDRPRELAGFLQTTLAWQRGWAEGQRPHVVVQQPTSTRIVRRRWPVAELHDLGDLAALLDVDQGELAWFADVRCWERDATAALRHYRWHTQPRAGGVRLIAAPKPRLKEIQRRLLRHVLTPIPQHDAAHGCVPGRSVRSAVAPHTGAAVVLRLDLESFFGSIPAGRVWGLLRTAGLPEPVAHTITGLVTTVVPRGVWRAVPVPSDADAHRRLGRELARPHLPQGAPTSPAAANLVSFALDRRLEGLARRYDVHYTRYVDDLIFSGSSALNTARMRFVAAVEDIVRTQGFRLNARKTVALGSSGRQQLLGAVVNDHPTLPRVERDRLRAVLHNCAVHGWPTQARGQSREQFRDHLLGRVAFAAGLDPAFGQRLRAVANAIDWS
jgi:RNA-directed DNA polymerase